MINLHRGKLAGSVDGELRENPTGNFPAKRQSSRGTVENEKRLPSPAAVGRRDRRFKGTEKQGRKQRMGIPYAHVTTDAQLKAAQTMGNILSRAV